MVACKKPLAMFPKTKKKLKSDKNNTKITQNMDNNCFREELLDDIDGMTEDQINLLKDTELIQSIAMTERDIDNKFNPDNMKDEYQGIDEIYNSTKLPSSPAKL